MDTTHLESELAMVAMGTAKVEDIRMSEGNMGFILKEGNILFVIRCDENKTYIFRKCF